MRYTFNDETEGEKRGLSLQVDSYDMQNNAPIKDCRVYGVSWVGDKGIRTCWAEPSVNYVDYPIGRYLKKILEQELKTIKKPKKHETNRNTKRI